MSISGGPNIIKNGLVLYLDAADDSSYVSGSTVWKDISGNSNNYSASLINGPVFTTSSKGMINFDGNNDYALLPVNFFDFDTGDPFTVSVWFKANSYGTIFGLNQQTGPDQQIGYVPAIYVGNDSKLHTSCFWGGSSTNQSVTNSSVMDGKFHNISVTFFSGTQVSYLDGVQYASLAKTQTGFSSNYYYTLGAGWGDLWPNFPGSAHYFSGNINNFIFYNRALSADEILQNFNSTKGRYNL